MRARRKKNLDKRASNASDVIVLSKTSQILGLEEEKRYEVFSPYDLFGNDNPLELEIGSGKGRFIIEKAQNNPQINYVGVEIQLNVIISGAEKVLEKGLKNVKLFNIGAEILKYTLPEKSISKLYLNFSCPYPKKQYENHRLTYWSFLEIYKYLLKDGAELHFKTDNDDFFEYSVNSLIENGFEITYLTRDLHNSDVKDNVLTEYEEKFIKLGKTINKLTAKMK